MGVGIGLATIAGFNAAYFSNREENTINKIENKPINQEITSSYSLRNSQPTISSIDGQAIVDAINSYQLNSSIKNTNDAFVFNTNQQITTKEALINNIQSSIKYFDKNSSYQQVYTLPESAINIKTDSQNYVHQVTIDLTKINGVVSYYAQFNPSVNDQTTINSVNNQLIINDNYIVFNAIGTEINQDLEVSSSIDVSKIIYISLGAVGGLGLILLMILLIKRKLANKYIKF